MGLDFPGSLTFIVEPRLQDNVRMAQYTNTLKSSTQIKRQPPVTEGKAIHVINQNLIYLYCQKIESVIERNGRQMVDGPLQFDGPLLGYSLVNRTFPY